MSETKERKTGKRRRWMAEDKAEIVRRHLQEGVSFADLAEETGAAPSQISRWCKEALEGLEGVFRQSNLRERRAADKALTAKETRIRQLQEVVTELSEEVLRLKKTNGER
jgi:transposase